jgi:Rieske Fe-S protein
MTDVQTRTATVPATGGDEPVRCGPASSRRAMLAGAGALGATCLLAACGTSSTSGTTNANGTDYSNNPAPAGSKGAVAQGGVGSGNDDSSGGGSKSGGGSGATALAATADVPSGGGIIKGDLVITQPQAGTFKAFSKVCTHAGCDVNKVTGGVISCPCHGSTFSIEDGSPTGGPATKPLPAVNVKVDGDNVVKA